MKTNDKKNNLVTILLLAGAAVFILLPLYMTIMIAIKDPSDMNNVLVLHKIRLQNFVDAWKMTDFPRKFLNTVIITVINLVFTLLTN